METVALRFDCERLPIGRHFRTVAPALIEVIMWKVTLLADV
jgi:hypothetical protein